jgi:hypothetical protein
MYRIIGADGREYGPFSADQLRQWIAESRAIATTPTLAEGATEWKPLGSLPEFSMLFAASAQAPAVPTTFSPATSGARSNGFAIAGFIIGLVSCFFGVFCCCIGPMVGIVGVVFSLIGLSQINRQPDVYSGKGFAIMGLVLSILGLVFYVAMMAFGLAIGSGGGTHHGYRL